MAVFQYKAGIGNVGSYQVSGKPFAKAAINASSATKVEFPSVTRWVMIKNNTSSDLKVGFSAAGLAGTNYFTLTSGSVTSPLELKITELHLLGATSVDVMAGLTFIANSGIDNPSLSPGGAGAVSPNVNWTGSTGVG
jgi:hypothetical protein